jgi:hypothetical protein
MLSLAQWKDARRVDHLTLPAVSISQGFYFAHPRFRRLGANARPDLKTFDQFVINYPNATNDFDRVGILGDVIGAATLFLNNPPANAAQRDTNAVQQLLNAARQDLGGFVGATQLADAVLDIVAVAQGQPLAAVQVTVNVVYVHPAGAAPAGGALNAIDATIDQQINGANATQALQDAALTIVRANAVALLHDSDNGHSILLTSPPAPANMAGKLQESAQGGMHLVTLCNTLPAGAGPQRVDLVYVPDFDQNDVSGFTFRVGRNYYGASPARPIVTITMNPPAAGGNPNETVAHEMGHALCNCGEHTPDANNLMAAGSARLNVQLSAGQIAWFRNNAFAG